MSPPPLAGGQTGAPELSTDRDRLLGSVRIELEGELLVLHKQDHLSLDITQMFSEG